MNRKNRIRWLMAGLLLGAGTAQGQQLKVPKLQNLQNIRVSGEIRVRPIYRNMSTYYSDMETDSKNLAFTLYPNISADGTRGQYPMAEVLVEANPTPTSSFAIGYSFSHDMLGLGADSSRNFTVRDAFRFEAVKSTKLGTFKLTSGGMNHRMNITPFTLSNREFREEPVVRLPWDWERNPVKKYRKYCNQTLSRQDDRFGQMAVQGFTLEATNLPADLGAVVFLGKSRLTASATNVDQLLPSNLFISRLYRGVKKHMFGVNYYGLWAETNTYQGLKDNRTVVTTDWKLSFPNFTINSEIGAGAIESPAVTPEWGEAVQVTISTKESLTKLPLKLQVYSIDHDVASIEGAYANSNINAIQGGFERDPNLAGNLMVNLMTEVSMLSNNRQGITLRGDDKFGKLKVEFGYAVGQEKENIYDTITFLHRVNTTARSRFRPFANNSGPYQRVRNRFRRSFEFISVTDGSEGYVKGFTALELGLKYSVPLGDKELLLFNYMTVNSVTEGLDPLPRTSVTDATFLSLWYEEISAYFILNKRMVVLGFFGVQQVTANDRTTLSTETGLPLDQRGYGYGFGLDMDLGRNVGLYLRQRWMEHRDENFVLDEFKGFESSVELKYFF